MLSATAMTSKEPITLAWGLFEVINPKTIPKLVTVDDVAPKLNLLGSLGSLNKCSHCTSVLYGKMFIIDLIFNSKEQKKGLDAKG